MIMAFLKSLTRLSAVVRKELIDIRRRPGAVLSLILGPFLIMAIFGAGYQGIRRPLETVLVIPPDAGLSREAADYEELAGGGFVIREIVEDPTAALALLQRQDIDLVVIAPGDLERRFRAGEQAVIQVQYNLTDPIERNYAEFLAQQLAAEVNQRIITRAVQEGQDRALQEVPGASPIPPEIVAEPTRVETTNLSPTSPNVVSFFGPAVVALILQHMAVTLTALSLVRERLSGVMEVFRIAPIGALELLVGKYIAFGLLNALIAGAVIGLITQGLAVPFLGSIGEFAGVVALLITASIGLGLFISVISDSERQAVQLSLLVLLASVFFSGFVLSIEEFIPEVRTAAYALPVTHGVRLMQDLMLRGTTASAWQAGVLAGIGAVLFFLTWLLLRRQMMRA